MNKLVGLVVLGGCLLAWRAEGQGPAAAEAGLYVSPAYSGDSGGPYVSPAFSDGIGPEAGPLTGAGLGMGVGGQDFSRAHEYGGFVPGAYSTPAFSGPVVGFRLSPPPASAEPKEGQGGVSGKPGSAGAAAGDGKADPAPGGGEGATNRVGALVAPAPEGTNSPTGQGSSSKP